MLNPFTPLASRNFLASSPETYENFYQTHELVWSWRFSIPLNPILQDEHIGHEIVARQKIDIQCLVWFRFTGQPGTLSLATAKLFTFESRDFESIELPRLIDNAEELLLYLKGYLYPVLLSQGLVIDVLSEAPRGYSLGFSGTFSGILAHLIHYLKKSSLETSKSESFSSFSHTISSPLQKLSPGTHGIMNDERLEISEIWRNIESIIKSPSTEGQNSYQTLYAEAAPSVFVFRKGRNGQNRELRKLVGIENNLENVLEYGVIYSGIPMLSHKIDLRAWQSEAKNGAAWCGAQLWVRISSKNYSDSLKQVLALENAHFLSCLDHVFDINNSQEIWDFLQYGNELAHSFEKLDGKSDFLSHIWKILTANGSLDRQDIAILPLYSTTKGGSYIWYGKRGVARKNLYVAMEEARKRYPELNIVFDGTVPHSNFKAEVSVEQDTRQKYTAKHSIADGYLIKNSGSQEVLKKYNSPELSKWRLLVDQIARKIYIDGEKVSSKEIYSQQLTIDLLEKFINQGSGEIRASDLPSSSYTQNKSEMMSKILSPLMRTVNRRLWSNLRVKCSGSVVDFVIQFEEVDLDILSIQKIGRV